MITRLGYNNAVVAYSHCFDKPSDGLCDDRIGDPHAHCGGWHYTGSMNQTACIDGYINGWKDWCNSDSKWCAYLITNGEYFPGVVYDATTSKTLCKYGLRCGYYQ